MAISEARDQFFLNECRVASFLSPKRRVSNASSKAPKSLKWPHSFLPAAEMAKAGFFFHPTQETPDNTICFLCNVSVNDWEKGDDPFVEHLTFSPGCGWAVVASIGASNEVLRQEHPMSARMIESRKATFANKWPHEGKKGWECEVKQMVDAGWMYTPQSDAVDMATCVYCDLGLDGWEPSDQPLKEHFKRSPDCTFFTFVNEHQQTTPKKASKSKKLGASKTARLSTQSAFTVASEAPSLADTATEQEDSILTTATNATLTSQGGRKMAKGKKPGTGKKTRAKKDEPIEVSMITEQELGNDALVVEVEKAKPKRGRKRTSDAIDESQSASMIVTHELPAKRRVMRSARGSVAEDDTHVLASIDRGVNTDMGSSEIPKKMPASRKKGRGSTAKSTRNFSPASTTLNASLQMAVPDDDEIDRILQADLERPLTDEEDSVSISKLEKSTTAAVLAPIGKTRVAGTSNTDYIMFGLEENKVDEAVIEAELEAMEADDFRPLPKAKGTKKRQGRKPSAKHQAAAKRAAHLAQTDVEASKTTETLSSRDSFKAHSPEVLNIDNSSYHMNLTSPPSRSTRASAMSANVSNSSLVSLDHRPVDIYLDPGNESDTSMASQATVIKSGPKGRGVTKNTKKGKRVVRKHIEEIISKPIGVIPNEEATEKAPKKRAGRTKANNMEELVTEDVTGNSSSASRPPLSEKAIEPTHAMPTSSRMSVEVSQPPTVSEDIPMSPGRLAASLSPQSSDAENRPPSKPPSAKPLTQSQEVIVPLTTTPSPSPKCITGLQTVYPWTAVDLDEILLKSPSENENKLQAATRQLGMALDKAKKGDLSSPERKMTVEEWILFNARLAEEKLRRDCDRMVGIFEKEGSKAMRVLEGIECLE